MRYILYWSPGAASLALHWMLIELGQPFEAVKVDIETGENRQAPYLKINPSGHLPALMVDGAVHTEVSALLMLIAEQDPQRRFDVSPGTADRADYLQWMVFLANTLQPAYRAWFYPHEPAGPQHIDAVQAQALQRIEAALDRLDARLADGRRYMLGQRLTALDFLATMLTRWSRNMPKPATEWPRLKAYINRMRAMPSLRETHRGEWLRDWVDG